ncbi:hypothetical protein HBH56_090000 [Parastagonospora nodorum]|nr:hypothetical protein HBH56_090000 [Parastagonospora nodorum]KAH3936514.1 hypothetical protein HBH54_024640 [Parastagonospora nodorum]KAH3945720.1 hypothetical protein HBH53_141740 [Parastagonospora nodorum]KAH4030038.1 hypothetical protein HBI13_036090 [Parastagonospora nodorum]KAH4034281.1 hypothetical protein HBI09_108550 [Parastagonospora nodorum]
MTKAKIASNEPIAVPSLKSKDSHTISTENSRTKNKYKKDDRGTYHMDRWLNETGKEEAWSVYARG